MVHSGDVRTRSSTENLGLEHWRKVHIRVIAPFHKKMAILGRYLGSFALFDELNHAKIEYS
jgi:hypothetical protein